MHPISTLEIVAGSLLILACIFTVVVVSLQSNKGGGMSSVIMGGEGTSVRGRSRDRDAKLASITKILAVVLFVATFVVSFIAMAANK